MLLFRIAPAALLLVLSYGCAHLTTSPDCKSDATTIRCVQYVRNYDADTVTVNIPETHPLFGHEISVRVAHIDSPEMKSKDECERKAAHLAQEFTKSLLVQAKRIDLESVERDKYFRILADVVVDGKSIGPILISKGLAKAYEGGKKEKTDWCVPQGSGQ